MTTMNRARRMRGAVRKLAEKTKLPRQRGNVLLRKQAAAFLVQQLRFADLRSGKPGRGVLLLALLPARRSNDDSVKKGRSHEPP